MQSTSYFSAVYVEHLFGYDRAISRGFHGWFSVFGSTFDESLYHLSLVLIRCKKKNLVLNWEKCHFMVNSGIVLGHIISERGIEVDKVKVELIAKLPPPRIVREVRSFLGHAEFYHRFIKDFSKISKPLCDLLTKVVLFEFTPSCLEVFERLKTELTSAPIIRPVSYTHLTLPTKRIV